MRVLAIVTVGFLAGCTMPGGAPGGGGEPDPAPDACGAAGLQDLVGQPLPEDLAVEGPVRVFAEGDPVTMDFVEERLNIELEADRRVVNRVFCG